MEDSQPTEPGPSSRMELLQECFTKCLAHGLKAPSFKVRHARSPAACSACSQAAFQGIARPQPLLWTPAQEFKGFFPGLPQPVVQALLDLYLQVLAHISAHSQVRVHPAARAR